MKQKAPPRKSTKPPEPPADDAGELATLRRQVAALLKSGDALARIVANPASFATLHRIEVLADWQIDRDTFNHKTNG